MYNSYFNFRKRPFSAVPQIDQYFPSASIEAARTSLTRCLQRGEGAGLVIGPSGTGKTLLCHLLADRLKTSFQVVLLTSGRLSTRRNLLQAILYSLGRPYRGMDEGELRLALIDHLTTHEEGCRGIVLLVDEAHALPIRLLEELRVLTNLASGGQPQVRLALAGGATLEERFASPKLESFSQRLVARCYLETLNRSETGQYISAQLEAAGVHAELLFPPETCHCVHQATDGVPRLINQVCDHALVLAYVAGRRKIEPANIQEAWADLQQLPTPWNGPGEEEKPSVIEFGRLDDAVDDAQTTVPLLRISQEADDPETNHQDPGEQIRHLEELLGVADEDEFSPADLVRPEVELIFEDPERLLNEPFEHEVAIADRYDSFAATPPPRANPDLEVARPQPEATQLPRSNVPASPTVTDRESPTWDSSASTNRQTVPLRAQQALEVTQHGDDRDIIVVEDDYEDSPAPPCRIVPVKRHEYSRLFARLRHG